MTALEEFIQWCTKDRAKLRGQLKAFESGQRSVRHRSIGPAWTWVDRTDQEIRRLKKSAGDLDALLTRLKNRGESGMPDRKKGDHKPASPYGKVIAKAERRLARADKQRAGIKADPRGEVAREQRRVKRAKKEKPDA
jgi:hypothetical protein